MRVRPRGSNPRARARSTPADPRPESVVLSHRAVVLDIDRMLPEWPHAIEAWFWLEGSSYPRDTVAPLHRDFLEMYHLSEQQVPLLRVDLSDETAPFSV